MDNFRFEIVNEINKKHGEVSRIKEEVEFFNQFEMYENKKRVMENIQKKEEEEKRTLVFSRLDLDSIFHRNIKNHSAFSSLIYNFFYYDYLPIVSFFKNCNDFDLKNIAAILSCFFDKNNFVMDSEKNPKEIFFKIITSPDLLDDKVKKIICSELFRVTKYTFGDVLNLKFCYGKKEEVEKYQRFLLILEEKNTISF